ncbi:DUF636 domain protein [Amylocarpus encephaloides]|uniref:DUF636 domain protein n=1 Tax=Amylocarpus encephaloides TaxID=45428 RepID=A0A9P8C6R2_9HELO|nr:DUF636 domain protein [Amylocarpus encephaloides]
MASGSCLCGAINFNYTGEPALTALCHCTDCQKWTGSAYTSNVAVPSTAFSITKGKPKKYDMKGSSGKSYPHYFCGDCGSSLYGEPEFMPGVTLVKAGTLDNGAAEIEVGVELYNKSRVGYTKPIDGAKQAETMA